MVSFVLHSPGRVLFSIGSFDVYVYGLIMAFAVLCGAIVSVKLSQRSSLPKDTFYSVVPLTVILGFLGARVWYCVLNPSLVKSFFDVFNFRDGGISIHGAILGGFLGLLYYSKREKISLSTLCDYAVPGLALGQAIGRWGNFFNNEAFGLPYDGFLKLYIPQGYRPEEFFNNSYFHPTFLYESVLDFILFILLTFLLVKKNFKSGVVTLIYLLLYSFLRFWIELLRVDATFYVLGFSIPVFVSILVFILSFVGLFILTKVNK